MDAAYSYGHRIDNRLSCAAKVSDTEVAWAFVKAEPKVDASDAAFQVIPMQGQKRNRCVVQCKEREASAEESESLPCPNTRILGLRDCIIPHFGRKASLSIFPNSRTGEETKLHPIVDGILFG
jgi:hypothetical protein